MPRKIKTVATVETLPDNRGYAVHNARTSKVLDHVFTSRLEAFAFAQEIAAYGTRTATRRLIQRLNHAGNGRQRPHAMGKSANAGQDNPVRGQNTRRISGDINCRCPCGPQRIAHRLEIARTIIDEG